jgi:hypothetical protein
LIFSNNKPLYGSIDFGIKLKFLSDYIYLNAGGILYGSHVSGLFAHITPGIVINFIRIVFSPLLVQAHILIFWVAHVMTWYYG